MPNYSPLTAQLIRQKPKWKHQPSKAIRVPEVFAEQLETIARQLDNGEQIEAPSVCIEASLDSIMEQIKSLPLIDLTFQELANLKQSLPLLIDAVVEKKQEAQCDRTLEQALLFLADRCDGASSRDGEGFNGWDMGFGFWLAQQIQAKQPILKKHAQAALRMLQKYHQQLAEGDIKLPDWEAIAHQYPATPQPEKTKLSERRLELIGNQVVSFRPYDADEIDDIKNIRPKGSFNRSDKGWYFPIEAAPALINLFPDAHIDPNIEGAIALLQVEREEAERQRQLEEAEAERQKLEAAERKANELIELINAAELNQPLANGWTLFEHQRKGVEWLLAHRRGGIYQGGILADEMGLGKTLELLVAAKAMQRTVHCSIFVICPASLKENWLKEAEKVGVGIEVYSWAKMPKPLEISKYLVIADESHYAQTLTSSRTQNLLALAQSENCLAAWLATATPIKNGRPINLYPLLLAIAHPLSGNKREYEKYYCAAQYKFVGRRDIWDTTGAAHLDELSKKTQDAILRRTKKDCLDLPPKIRTLKPVELTNKQAKEYKAEINSLIQDYRDRAQKGLVDPDAEALVRLNILRRIGSEYKVEAAVEMAEELLEQGQQVVLFTEFLESAKALHQRLGGELLTGETKTDERQALVDRFQSGESKVFIGTIKAGGVGLTLTEASNVILVDRPWTPGDTAQAEDRCHRIGTKDTVTAFWLQLGAIDEAIDSLLESKQERIELVLKGKRKTLKGIKSPKDLAKELLTAL